MLHGTVSANNEIVFDPLPAGQAPFSAATAAYAAGRLVQIDATDAGGNWNTILTLSRVGLDELQFFNYEETESYGEQRLQLVKMLDDSSATYDYIEVPSKTSQLTNDSGFLTNHQDISGKQDKSTLEADVAAAGFTKNTGTYSKPTGGIPKADLAAAVQTSLDKADSALQRVPISYRTAVAQDAIDRGKVDKVDGKGLSTNDYTDAAKAKVDAIPANPKYTDTVYDDTALKERVATIEGKESAWDAKSDFSGSYNDLTDKPTIPTALPNPNAITFTGDVAGVYDGSAPMSVHIPTEVTPLIGTTNELTTTQVYDAVSSGIPVRVQYTDSTYGLLSFTAFNVAESLKVIVSQTIVYYKGKCILAELFGNVIQGGSWGFYSTMLSELKDLDKLDVRVNELEGAGYLTLATLPKYGGESE